MEGKKTLSAFEFAQMMEARVDTFLTLIEQGIQGFTEIDEGVELDPNQLLSLVYGAPQVLISASIQWLSSKGQLNLENEEHIAKLIQTMGSMSSQVIEMLRHAAATNQGGIVIPEHSH